MVIYLDRELNRKMNRYSTEPEQSVMIMGEIINDKANHLADGIDSSASDNNR